MGNKDPATIRFKSRLLRPAKKASWTFLVLPKNASAKLPTRSMVTVTGKLAGQSLTATLEPDGQGSHWLKINNKLRESASINPGDDITLEITPVSEEPEPKVPTDLRRALAVSPAAKVVWKDITPVARRDWIFWITSAKKPETRQRRITNTCDMLASGKRRACCFDRSGIYSTSLDAPEAAE